MNTGAVALTFVCSVSGVAALVIIAHVRRTLKIGDSPTSKAQRTSTLSPLRGAPGPQPGPSEWFTLNGKGAFEIEVVGESYYQAALLAIVDRPGYQVIDVTARLVCESDNVYDDNAVKVEIGGLCVGHLPREAAPVYRDQIARAGFGTATGVARARIYGGGDKFYGVWLDI